MAKAALPSASQPRSQRRANAAREVQISYGLLAERPDRREHCPPGVVGCVDGRSNFFFIMKSTEPWTQRQTKLRMDPTEIACRCVRPGTAPPFGPVPRSSPSFIISKLLSFTTAAYIPFFLLGGGYGVIFTIPLCLKHNHGTCTSVSVLMSRVYKDVGVIYDGARSIYAIL